MPLLALLLAADAPVATPGDVLAPARAGMLQCYQPDTQAKTCRSMAAYRQVEGAHYVNTARVLLSPTSAVTLETEDDVVVRNGAVCGAITADGIARGTLRVGDRFLTADQARSTLGKIQQAMASVIGKEICTTYTPATDGFIATATLDGAAMPGEHQRVIWVKLADGYVVAPVPQ